MPNIYEADQLDPYDFEKYIANMFGILGYQATITPKSGDFGADIVLRGEDQCIVVQAKQWRNNVGIKAVQEVYAAKQYYNATEAIVVTNSFFTEQAIELAESTSVTLFDRDYVIHLLQYLDTLDLVGKHSRNLGLLVKGKSLTPLMKFEGFASFMKHIASKKDPLIQFLRDVALHMKAIGNNKGTVYGYGGLVINHRSMYPASPGTYGRGNRQEACVYDSNYVAIRVDHMIQTLNASLSKTADNEHSMLTLRPYIESSFNKAKERKGDGLVLAPNNYRIVKKCQGKPYENHYTVFNMKYLREISDIFLHNEYWDINNAEES